MNTNAVSDDYEISSNALGVGINGQVYKCIHRTTGRLCALKVYILLHVIAFN